MIALAAVAGQFVRVLLNRDGEFIPLTLADWDVRKRSIDLVIQGVGTSTKLMNSLCYLGSPLLELLVLWDGQA